MVYPAKEKFKVRIESETAKRSYSSGTVWIPAIGPIKRGQAAFDVLTDH